MKAKSRTWPIWNMPLRSFTLASNTVLKDTLIFIQVLEGRLVSELTRDVAPWGGTPTSRHNRYPSSLYRLVLLQHEIAIVEDEQLGFIRI